MSNIPENIGKLLDEVGANKLEDAWQVRTGIWAVKHKALEKVAAHLGIVFEQPKIICAEILEKAVAIQVNGYLPSGVSAWSIGEAATYNNKNGYPFAMAEKRAKDRVILKLCGLHGDAYSEEEADDFRKRA